MDPGHQRVRLEAGTWGSGHTQQCSGTIPGRAQGSRCARPERLCSLPPGPRTETRPLLWAGVLEASPEVGRGEGGAGEGGQQRQGAPLPGPRLPGEILETGRFRLGQENRHHVDIAGKPRAWGGRASGQGGEDPVSGRAPNPQASSEGGSLPGTLRCPFLPPNQGWNAQGAPLCARHLVEGAGARTKEGSL